MGSARLARLVRVRVCVADAPTSRLPKLSELPEKEYPGVPVPVSAAVSVLPEETTESVPVRAPSAVGVNVTPMVQLVPAATAPQLLETMLKSPVAVADFTELAKLELLVQVKVLTGLVKLTAWEPKSCVRGTSEGWPPSSVSSKSMYSRSFSWGVIGPPTHSDGKFC